MSVAFRAQNVCWHNQSSNILELLGGVIFRELSDLLVVHIPTLQFENLLVPFMYDKEEMAYEYFEDKISPLRILLIEDTLIAQKITCRRLMKKNHIVKVVENGVRALEILRHESFDLVIMDIQMPIMDGFETTIKIRERDEKIKAHTPIIALTAFAMPGDRERCFMCGMDDYVTKSSTEQELHDAIFRVMKKTTTDRQVFKKAS